MYALRKRWQILLDNFPARKELRRLEEAYALVYDEWERTNKDYHDLYAKHLDLLDEVRYWEARHAKIMNYIEKQMEMDKGGQ